MYGAILGDIISQQYKFDKAGIFYLVDRKFKFTDYTVMTAAIADALLTVDDNEELNEKRLKADVMKSLIAWGKKYINADYAQKFKRWLDNKDASPFEYFDFSTAAAISIIPYIYKRMDHVKTVSKWIAEIAHNDPQGIQNTEVIAAAIYYAKDCPYKAVIKSNLEFYIGYPFDDTENLQNIVLESFVDFFRSTDIESTIYSAISRGGDINTRAVIAGGIAEAFYGLPSRVKTMCNQAVDEDILNVLDRFDQAARRIFVNTKKLNGQAPNKQIEEAIYRFNARDSKENFNQLMNAIHQGMYEGLELYVPLLIKNRSAALDGDSEYLKLTFDDNKTFVAAFTSMDEKINEIYPDILMVKLKDLLESYSDEDTEEDGIIINPHDYKKNFALTKDLISQILQKEPPKNGMWFFSGHISKWKTEIAVSSEYDDVNYALFEDVASLAAAHFMTKAHNDTNNYMIYTPLVKYRGDDEKVIRACYWFCLDLAKKYNIHSISFPFNICLNVAGIPGMNEAIGSWLKKNKNYGMMVFVATGEDKNSDEGQLFRVEFMDNEPNDNYELVKWNGKYGDEARFIVKYNKTGKFTLFTPDHIEDIVWVDQDLSQTEEYKHWEDFGGETVNYLENVMM